MVNIRVQNLGLEFLDSNLDQRTKSNGTMVERLDHLAQETKLKRVG